MPATAILPPFRSKLVPVRSTEPPRFAPPPASSFAQRFCQQQGIDEEQFAYAVLERSLRAPACWIAPLLIRIFPNLFEADYCCVCYCGSAYSRRDLEHELSDFRKNRINHGLWRGQFGLRLSTRRLRRLFDELERAR